MKQTLLKIWYVIIALGSLLAYLNRDYVLEGQMTSDLGNWMAGVFNDRVKATVKKTDCDKEFVLMTADGEVLVPERMLRSFEKDGLNVWLSYQIVQEKDPSCELGKLIAISKMKQIR